MVEHLWNVLHNLTNSDSDSAWARIFREMAYRYEKRCKDDQTKAQTFACSLPCEAFQAQ